MRLTPPNPLVPPIRTDGSNAFADHTVRVRLVDILNETLASGLNFNQDHNVVKSFNRTYRVATEALRDEIAAGGLIEMLPPLADAHPEYQGWVAACQARAGATWRDVDWFFCETFMYRRLMQAIDYFQTHLDPFSMIKYREYQSDIHQTVLDNALAASHSGDAAQSLDASLRQAVFGNRVDLSYAESRAHGLNTSDSDLLVDDRRAVIDHLLGKPAGVVHLVVDNAGSELSADLCLVDLLLRENIATQVVLHAKFHPTFVSDATKPEIKHFLEDAAPYLRTRPPSFAVGGLYGAEAEAMSKRLHPRLGMSFIVQDEYYWNSPYFAWEMPDDLAAELQAASLVIVKGDANYRRFVGDAFWPHETPFADVVGGLGMNLLMLRTLKSDPLVGLATGVAETLESQDPRWRWSGKRAVIQAHLLEYRANASKSRQRLKPSGYRLEAD